MRIAALCVVVAVSAAPIFAVAALPVDTPAERQAEDQKRRQEERIARLAEMRARIAATRDELKKLAAQEAELLKEIGGGADEPHDAKAFASLDDLLGQLPENARPSGSDDDLERIRANEWLQEHAQGRPIKLKWEIASVDFSRPEGGDGKRFNVLVKTVWTQIDAAGVKSSAMLGGSNRVKEAAADPGSPREVRTPGRLLEFIQLSGVDDDGAQKLRGLRGKTVEIEGVLWHAEFPTNYNRTTFLISLEQVGVDGIFSLD